MRFPRSPGEPLRDRHETHGLASFVQRHDGFDGDEDIGFNTNRPEGCQDPSALPIDRDAGLDRARASPPPTPMHRPAMLKRAGPGARPMYSMTISRLEDSNRTTDSVSLVERVGTPSNTTSGVSSEIRIDPTP